jgi:hypothetical protein
MRFVFAIYRSPFAPGARLSPVASFLVFSVFVSADLDHCQMVDPLHLTGIGGRIRLAACPSQAIGV